MEPAAQRFLDGLLAAVQDDPRIVGLLLAGSARAARWTSSPTSTR
jgi:hypothetical protein